jgi:Arc/MetJ-type ribon-helix-helix transcriptional regulator
MQAVYPTPNAQLPADSLNIKATVSKISISLDQTIMGFMESYRQRHQTKSRSQVVDEALRLLEQREQERLLEEEYAASAPEDRIVLKDFEHTMMDGLEHEAW